MPEHEVASTVADLYQLSLDQFTGARDQLAHRLRTEGSDEADQVAKLRKPSVAAWALNRAAHDHSELVDQLLESHRQLREADSANAIQMASEARRRAVTVLVDAALAELRADGRPESLQTREKINRTLLAVATDPQGETDLGAGTLVRELEPSGGGWGDMTLPPPPRENPRHVAEEAAGNARAKAEKLEIAAVEAERRLEAAKQAVTDARRRAKQSRLAADQAAKEAREAEKTARETSAT
ncbi:MAG: hypothetical protein ACRDZM_09610 [Acidimicrobiia bacterium]